MKHIIFFRLLTWKLKLNFNIYIIIYIGIIISVKAFNSFNWTELNYI